MKIIEVKEFTIEYFQAIKKFINLLTSSNIIFTEDYFKELIASNNSHLYFIIDGNNIAGMLTVGTYKSPTGTKAWIEDVVIDNIYRGQGLGKLITQHAIDFSKSQGIELLMLTSNPTRMVANLLYQSLNFEQKETNVYRMKFDK